MKIVILISTVFAISACLLLYLDYKLKKNHNDKLYNNIKKLEDANRL